MSYSTAITELRQILSDTSTHKKATRKKIFGNVNGDNAEFITYDKRILEDTVEVFVDGLAVDFEVTDAVAGKLTLKDAPTSNSKVEASYYFQWWLDDELTTFLNKGAELTGQFSTSTPDKAYLQILPGLKNAALYFAASEATTSLIHYLINREHSEEFLVEQDGNDDSNFSEMIKALKDLGKDYWERAKWHRDDYYKSLGKRELPAFAVKIARFKNYGPNR